MIVVSHTQTYISCQYTNNTLEKNLHQLITTHLCLLLLKLKIAGIYVY